MTITITPQVEQMVQSIIRSGLYKDEAAVLEEGLRLIQRKEEFRQEMQRAIDAANRGELLEEDDFFRELEAYADQLANQPQ